MPASFQDVPQTPNVFVRVWTERSGPNDRKFGCGSNASREKEVSLGADIFCSDSRQERDLHRRMGVRDGRAEAFRFALVPSNLSLLAHPVLE